ncbi:MAG: hypothetical protein IPN70_05025 [Candidatus Moraniibacteriota bacterium]|nr:MAG: hypothetical protein IPN70_05025 [Candidatus Moranbacteria bacterium]
MFQRLFFYLTEKIPSDVRWRFLGVIIIVWIVGVATFANDAILVSGSVSMPTNASQDFFSYVEESEWRGFLWYGVFWLLDTLNFSNGSQLTIYLDFFLFFSFLSMRWAIYKVFPHASHFTVFSFSLVYAINIFTLHLVASGKIFTPLGFAYAFLPAFIASYRMFLRNPSIGMGAICSFFFFLFSTLFLYPSALIVTVVFFLIMTISIAIFTESFFSWKKMISFGILILSFLLVSAYAIPSALIRLEYGKDTFFPQTGIEQSLHLLEKPSSLLQVSRWLSLNYAQMFPYASPYKGMHTVGILLTLLPLIWLISGWFLQKKSSLAISRRFFWSMTTILLFFTFFISGFPGFTGFFGNRMWTLPGMAALGNGSDFLLFLPSLGIFIGICAAMFSKKFTFTLALSAILTSFVAFPFFVGGVYKNNQIPINEKNEIEQEDDFDLGVFVTLPEEYYKIGKRFRESTADGFIARLPYGPKYEESEWDYFPSYSYFGEDIFSSIFDRKTISPQSSYFERWNYAKTFSQSNQDPKWLTVLLGLGNVRYVIVHKDGVPGSFQNIQEKVLYLEKIGEWKKVVQTDVFDMYRLRDERIFPLFYVHNFTFSFLDDPSSILASYEDVNKTEILPISYIKNESGYVIHFDKKISQKILTFSEPFNALWSATLVHTSGEKETLSLKRSLGFFNGWNLSNIQEGDQIEIVFAPKKFASLGMIISLVSLFIILGIIILAHLRKRRKKLISV